MRPILLKKIVDVHVPAGDGDGIMAVAISYFGLLILSIVCSYYQVVVLSSVGTRVVNGLKADLFSSVLNLDKSYFSETPSGKILARIESDTEQIKALLSAHTIRLAGLFLMMIAICGSIGANMPGFAAALAITLIVVTFVLFAAMGRLRVIYDRVREAYKELSGFLTEYIRGVPTIQVFDVRNRVAENLDRLNREKLAIERVAVFWNYGFLAGLRVITGPVILSMVVWYGSGRIAGKTMTVGQLIMLFEYCRYLFEPLSHLAEELAYMQNSFVSLNRVYGILELKPSIIGGGAQVTEGIPEIRFEGVWFAYEGENWVVKDLDLVIPPGSKVAVVGPSGSGKSTLVRLLLRFYEPQRGRILVGGRDIREFELESLRAVFGLVVQDMYFFPGTLLDNLRVLEDELSADLITELVEKLGILPLIMGLEAGIESKVAEGGKNFSTGERQLFAFARALARNPSILVLDEATAFVDTNTEKIVQESIRKHFAGGSVFSIAHRLSTVRECDMILVLKDGSVVERGTHAQLVSAEGIYASMYETQMVGGVTKINSPGTFEDGVK